jgi:3-oxoacyl-[acyl-carrier-protein] synthase II
MSHPRRVAVTGIGLVTGLGVGTAETWKALLDGLSAVAPVTAFDAGALAGQLAATVPGFDAADFASKRLLRSMSYSDQLGLAAAVLAMRDAEYQTGDGTRDGLFVGSGKEISDPAHLERATAEARRDDGTVDVRRFGEVATQTAYPLFYVEGLQAASLFYISQAFGLRGVNTYFDGAAEAGAQAVAAGFRAVRDGHADRALTGGCADAASWWGLAQLDALGMLSPSSGLGTRACRPLGAERDGTVPGDGAAFLLLEDWAGAVARGARIYAEMIGEASTQQPLADAAAGCGIGIDRAVRIALSAAAAGGAVRPVGLAVCGASGSPAGDRAEAAGLAAALGGAVPVTSAVAATGNLMAAQGAMNAALAVLSLHHGVVPSVLPGVRPDPECPVSVVHGQAIPAPDGDAVSTARGLYGQSVALAFRRPEGE